MKKLIECVYDDDENTIIATLENGNKEIYSCSNMQDTLDLNICTNSKFEWFAEHCPDECLELYLNNTLQEYLNNYENQQNNQQQNIITKLEKTIDKPYAEMIARDFTVYGENS